MSRLARMIGVTVLFFLWGCSEGASEPGAAASVPVESVVERGPLSLRVSLPRKTMTVGDRISLSIEVNAPIAYDIEMPVLPDDEPLGAFGVRETNRPPDIPAVDSRRWHHTYVLDTFVAGELEIPPFEVAYTPGHDAPADAEAGVLMSDPLQVVVESVLESDAGEQDFRDIRPETAVRIDGPARSWWPILIGAVVAAIVSVVVVIVFGKVCGSGEQAVPELPPGAWALGALDDLAAKGLVDAGQYETFYDRLSGIVRVYVERRFGLMAPERTTEEFLREAGQSRLLSGDHRGLLEEFLRAADMVKFARQTPTAGECSNALSAARSFVHDTASDESHQEQSAC